MTAVGEDAVIVTSWILMVTAVECVSVPLTPDTVMEYDPGEPLQESFEVPVVAVELTMTLAGVNVQVRPLGATVSVRVIVPLSLFREVRVIVEFAIEPGWTETVEGDAEMVKSGMARTFTLIITE